MVRPGTFVRSTLARRLLIITSVVFVAGIALLLPGNPDHGISASAAAAPHAVLTTAATTAATPAISNSESLSLGITDSPRSICAFGLDTCAAAAATSRVTLTANAGSTGILAWPNVQVAFVIETVSDDGVYDPLAGDGGLSPCTATTMVMCEESNGVPFFVANAQQIANAIQAANPHSQVSFAMVDYFANLNNWDDGDGAEYHVDIPSFVPSAYFGSEVTSTFQANVLQGGFTYGDSDMADNQLTSPMITAMYGTIIGSGLDWSNNTHHVIVWMGSTAPRDPNYPENYCASWEDQFNALEYGCIGATCEPSYTFQHGTSPNCEGWVKSQDGNATHNIAALAHTAPQCTLSIGGDCTVDMIDLYNSNTDPLSQDWPANVKDGGPGGLIVQENVDHTLLAGCDMAAATGGTWNGPAWFTCPNGQSGSLQYVPHGKYNQPNTQNPTLFSAFKEVGFGPILETQVASGSNRPIFQYIPFGNIVPAKDLQATAACVRNGEDLRTCQTIPTILHFEGLTYLGWNWSTNSTSNVMFIGDYWTASFNVMATGPPYATVPVDACTTIDCKAGGSGPVEGLYTSASYVPYSNNSVVTESFPLAQVQVQVTPPTGPPPNVPPPPPPIPPPFPIPATVPTPVIQQIGIGNNVGVANVSLQATAAGFLGAGFMRVGIKNRPIAMKVAAKAGPQSSIFDAQRGSQKASGIGRFE